MTTQQHPAQFFDWATELSDAQGHVTLSEQEAHEIGARLRRLHSENETLRVERERNLNSIRVCNEIINKKNAELESLRTGYAAARLEIESLQRRVQEVGAVYADLMQAASDWICEHVENGTPGVMMWAIRLQSAAQKLRASHGQAPAQAAPAYKDSTPETHVGDSAFESWYSTYSPAHKADKQRAHDAYAAGRVNHKAQAIQGVQWQCGPQASGITVPQADSQPAVDEATAMGRTRELAESGRWPSDWVEAYRRGYSDRAARAQADSVLEDAARLDWLDQQCEAYGFQDIHEGNRWEISGPYANVRVAIDAERAARKQGGA